MTGGRDHASAAAGGRKDSGMTALGNQAPSGGEPDASTGQLVKQLSEEMSQLVRAEVRLATLEMTGKAKTGGCHGLLRDRVPAGRGDHRPGRGAAPVAGRIDHRRGA